MGDAAAISHVKAARDAQRDAESTIDDLKIALPAAQAQLAAAEKNAESARHELAKLLGEKIMRRRVAAAARMDVAFAEAASAYSDFERLGRELQSFPDLNLAAGGNMSFYEGATGFRRIAASLPLFFLKLFPGTWTNEAARTPLAQSEAHFWQLAPEQPKSKAA
jgi:outer membrane protein TolC